MPDRIIRDELLESDRWLDLPTDTHRLVYENILLIADDYGNFEGGPRRLWRWMHRFTQVKSETDSIKLMSDLQDADMVLRYEDGGKEYWHITRFKNSRWYWKREVPKSPHPEDVTNEAKQRPTEKRNTHVGDALPTRIEGVGVGVGVGVDVGLSISSTSNKGKKKQNAVRAARSPFVLPDWIPKEPWDAWVEARKKTRKPPTDYALRLAVRKLDSLRDQGQSPAQVLMQSAFNGWADLYPQKETR